MNQSEHNSRNQYHTNSSRKSSGSARRHSEGAKQGLSYENVDQNKSQQYLMEEQSDSSSDSKQYSSYQPQQSCQEEEQQVDQYQLSYNKCMAYPEKEQEEITLLDSFCEVQCNFYNGEYVEITNKEFQMIQQNENQQQIKLSQIQEEQQEDDEIQWPKNQSYKIQQKVEEEYQLKSSSQSEQSILSQLQDIIYRVKIGHVIANQNNDRQYQLEYKDQPELQQKKRQHIEKILAWNLNNRKYFQQKQEQERKIQERNQRQYYQNFIPSTQYEQQKEILKQHAKTRRQKRRKYKKSKSEQKQKSGRDQIKMQEFQDNFNTSRPSRERQTEEVEYNSVKFQSGLRQKIFTIFRSFNTREQYIGRCQNIYYEVISIIQERLFQQYEQAQRLAYGRVFNRQGNKPYSCRCEHSNCIKLYCECFKVDQRCGPYCSCTDCKNFFYNNGYKLRLQPFNIRKQQCVKCNCRRNQCLKNYCECKHVNEYCNERCTCKDCHNNRENRDIVKEILSQRPRSYK